MRRAVLLNSSVRNNHSYNKLIAFSAEKAKVAFIQDNHKGKFEFIEEDADASGGELFAKSSAKIFK